MSSVSSVKKVATFYLIKLFDLVLQRINTTVKSSCEYDLLNVFLLYSTLHMKCIMRMLV